MPRGKAKRHGYRDQDEMGRIFEANPGLYFFAQGESEFQSKDFLGAIQDFSTALCMLELVSTSPPQLTVKALLRRAQCFLFLCQLDRSVRDCTTALNISEAIDFQEGIFEANLVKISIIEAAGDIRGAFLLAVSLKALDFKEATSHVGRLREILEQIFRQDPTLADELGDNLIRSGTEHFTNNRFKEAAEYFTEVIRVVCKFSFVRDAYVYQAKCHVELGEYEEARDLCMTVLTRFPDDEDGKLLLETIDTITLERKKGAEGTKKKTSKKPSSSRMPEKLVVPEKKSVPNKKQRKKEEYRRMKEAEEMLKDFQSKIKEDQEKQGQKREEENRELDGAKSHPTPSYDVKAALDASNSRRETPDKQIKVQVIVGPGARPKQRKPIEVSGKTQDRNNGNRKQKDVGLKRNGKAISETGYPALNLQSQCRGFASLDVSVEGRMPLPVKSTDSEWDVSNTNQTAPTLPDPDDGWILVTPKRQRLKSVAERTSIPDCPSLPGPSLVQYNSTLQGSSSTATKDFSANRVELQELKYEQKFRRNFRRGSALASSGLAESRTVDSQNSPKSQWESLQIHGVLTTKVKSDPPLDRCISPQVRSNVQGWAPPQGVSTLCAHFLEDNRKGQPYQYPSPCSKCTKQSKLLHGTWRSDTKEWQVMRPYPKDVNPDVPFQLCRHFSNRGKCQKNHCTFAHGKKELMFWTLERQSGHAPFGRIAGPEDSHHENDFQGIPKVQERVRGSLTIRDIRSTKPRPPPTGIYNGKFQLCKWWNSGRVCRYGVHCSFAHGENELESWMRYNWEIQEPKREEELSCQTPQRSADISKSAIQMIYSLHGVEVSSNKPATVKISHRGEERHNFHWEFTVKFKITEVGKLCQIDLLHRYHKWYRLTKITGFLNNVQQFSGVPQERWSYNLPNGSWNDTREGQMKVVVSISFEATACTGTFTQCLRFDFGKEPFLLQGLNVDIASEEALDKLSATREELKLHSSVWKEGPVDIIPAPETSDMSSLDLLLLKEYKLPERIENVISAQVIDGNMTVDNYKRVMHQLLFTEELFMKKAISSFVLQNVQLECQQSISNEWSGAFYAGTGELFGIVKFQDNESLQPDDAAGRLLTRNVNSAWIKMAGSSSQKVYETLVQKIENDCVALKLSPQTCLDLKVSAGVQIVVDVQFQLNRKPLCDWHAAIDRLGPLQLRLLFPTPSAPQIKMEEKRRWNWLALDTKLNTNQREVIERILAPGNTSSPLVVFGPFGTGKTLTLNQAIRQLVTRKRNRILLCTHTNSAADLHVKLLHDYLTDENGLEATKPLRIYQTDRRLNADSEVARMYGLIANNAYVLPTRDDVIRHRVVITTLAMSQHLLELQLNHGFFTHILVDEAAQALEPEALIPLALAGPNTKVVFTGDHMQMSLIVIFVCIVFTDCQKMTASLQRDS